MKNSRTRMEREIEDEDGRWREKVEREERMREDEVERWREKMRMEEGVWR